MKQNNSNARKNITACYDHLGGIFGEVLFDFFIKKKWIQREKNGNDYVITPLGWNELISFGIDVKKLRSTKRKQVTFCTEKYHGILHEHTGAYLGTLLKELFTELGWLIEQEENNYTFTVEGLESLELMGIDVSALSLNR